ncbi:MAG: RIP metalloprotease RseP [bacterium]|nr:RIP metalloprotease RseP [bacterium]
MFFTILNYIYVGFFVLFFFGFCIFIHELGHFLAAKWRKLHIVAFSIGFKKIWAFKHKGIEYRIGCLPFGGYVDIPQLEPNSTVKDSNGRPLPTIKPINRIIVAFAGPFFNILFGFVLATMLWYYGIPSGSPKMSTIKVATVQTQSPEYKAGLRPGDEIVRINGSNFDDTWDKVIQQIIFTIGKVKLGIKEGDSIKTISYEPIINKTEMPALSKAGLPYPFFTPEIPIIINVQNDSQAAKDGLKTGDRILAINNKITTTPEKFYIAIAELDKAPINIKLVRDGKTIELSNIKTTALEKATYYMIGIPVTQDVPIMMTKSIKGSAAYNAGIKQGDYLIKANGIKLTSFSELSKIIKDGKGKTIDFTVMRDNKILNINVTPKLFTPHYIEGISVVFRNHITPWQQFTNVISMSYKSLRGIFSQNSYIKAKHLSGPIGIVTVIGTAVYHGSLLIAFNIIAIITFSLALLNLLPLPVLDGGHILLSIVEMIIGRPLPSKLMQPICMLFVLLLISLMIFVTFNDINRLTNISSIFDSSKNNTKTKPVNKNKPIISNPTSKK